MWQCSASWDGNGAALACTRSALFTELLSLRSMQHYLADACLLGRDGQAQLQLAVCKALASFIEPSVDLVRDT